jgi:HAD superfamily hydrolase (TIGR01509 family)
VEINQVSAIFFGSIGTIADTSELQRQAFNQAFALHHLDWNWSREEYRTLLEKSGGAQRIEDYAESMGRSVDAQAIHRSKSEIFQDSLGKGQLEPRSGVVEVIEEAKQKGFKLAWVTTTSEQNVESLIRMLHSKLDASAFDLVLNSSKVQNPKPAQDAYDLALKELAQSPADCVAIENNLDGLKAAKGAGLACIAFPDENTAHHHFEGASLLVNQLDFGQVQEILQRHG